MNDDAVEAWCFGRFGPLCVQQGAQGFRFWEVDYVLSTPVGP